MKFEVIQLTPELAAQMATRIPTFQRSIRKEHMASIADAIVRGEWVLTGEPIIQDEAGNILDGQHRIYAVIKAGIPITVVLTTIPVGSDIVKVYGAMGLQVRREGGDFLKQQGYSHYNALSAATTFVYKLTNKEPIRRRRISNAQLKTFLEANPELPAYVANARTGPFLLKRGYLTPSNLAGLWYLMSRKDAALADWFFTKLYSGDGLQTQDAVYQLRSYVEQSWRLNRQIPSETLVAVAIKAWNATRAGKPVNRLAFLSSETFPEIQ